MPLHIEDEFIAADFSQRRGFVKRAFIAQFERAAALAGIGVGGVEGHQSAGGAAGGNEKFTAGLALVAGQFAGPLQRQVIGSCIGAGNRNRLELAVRSGIDLDWQPGAVIVVFVHLWGLFCSLPDLGEACLAPTGSGTDNNSRMNAHLFCTGDACVARTDRWLSRPYGLLFASPL